MPPLFPHSINAYARVNVETGAISASPHKLVLMLFEGARLAVTEARLHMQHNETAAKGEAISKAIAIIDHGLKASLDVGAGGEMAEKLHALYEYMTSRLLVANLRNQPEALDEVGRLLAELNGAWEAIDDSNSSRAGAALRPHQAGAISRRPKV
jgi:flagellar protein FliS